MFVKNIHYCERPKFVNVDICWWISTYTNVSVKNPTYIIFLYVGAEIHRFASVDVENDYSDKLLPLSRPTLGALLFYFVLV